MLSTKFKNYCKACPNHCVERKYSDAIGLVIYQCCSKIDSKWTTVVWENWVSDETEHPAVSDESVCPLYLEFTMESEK